jgi:hypothetical protein
VDLAHAGRAEHDHVVCPLHEAHAGEFADLAPIQAGLKLEVELHKRLQPGEASLAQPKLRASLVATLPFGLRRLGQESLAARPAVARRANDRAIGLALDCLLAHGIRLRFQVVHPELAEKVF